MAYTIQSIPDRQVLINGKPHFYFGGTAYLGVQNHQSFKQLYLKSVSTYGMQYGASRKSNISLDIYGKTENHLAEWVGSESCLTMSSGYLAAQLIVQTLIKNGHTVFAAPNAHAALFAKEVIVTKSSDELAQLVSNHIVEKSQLPIVLFDTIDFLGEQFPDFKTLKKLPLDKVMLIGDDSHGIGVLGENGSGCYRKLKDLEPAKLLVCCSLGKALGIQAGAVFGNSDDINMLQSTSFFGGASPASPASMGTLLGASKIYAKQLEKLKGNYLHFNSLIKNMAFFTHLKGHPTFEFQNKDVASSLKNEGFIITNFNYPDDSGPIVSRIVLSAYHKKEDIQKLAQCLNTILT